MALAFFYPRSSRGPQGLLKSAIWKKCLFSTKAQTVWHFDFCCFSDNHYFLILRAVNFIVLFDPRSSRGTYGVKWWKMRGLAPNQYWPTDFFLIFKKKIFLQPHINSKEHYLGGILNFVPKLKLKPVFKKKF
jgi:hypothetical protein